MNQKNIKIVPLRDGYLMARDEEIPIFKEVSALENIGVHHLFLDISKKIY